MGVTTIDMYQEVTDYIWKNYPQLHGLYPEILKKLISKHPEKLIVERDINFNILGVGFFCKMNDIDLARIKDGELWVTSVLDMIYLLNQKGENIHFIFAVTTKGINTILKGLRNVIEWERPKTVSWFSQNLKCFNIRTLRG